MRTEDGYIIRKCLAGDSAAFGFLVDKYKGSVYAFAYSRLRNFHDAEDVAQEVFINAYQKLRTLRRWDNVLAWLYSITSNLCKMHIRAQSRRPDDEFMEDQDLGDLENSSMNSYREERIFRSLRDALDSLPEIHRQVLTLHYLGGMKIKELARFLGTSPSTIARRLRKARLQLRKEMLGMVSKTFEEKSLHAAFTLRIVEMVNRMRMQPLPRTTGLPWGLSVATGIIIAVLSLSPRVDIPDAIASPTASPIISKMEAAEIGEMPVEVLNAPRPLRISSKQGSDYSSGVMFLGQQNAVFMAPGGEGGKIPEEPSAQLGKGFLHGIAYSPDGEIFAAATSLGIKLYDAGNLNETGILIDEPYSEIAFSPDGRTLAGSADDGIYLWDFQAKKQIGSVQAGSVIALSPDGGILAATGIYGDNVIRLWDAQKLERIGLLQGHTEYICTIAFTPDGKTLASAGYDKTIRLWSVREQKQIGLLEGHKEVVFSMAVSPDGKVLASGSEENNEGILLLWDIQEQKLIGSLEGHEALLTSMAFSPDGKMLVSGSDDQIIRIWDVQEQKQIGSLPGDTRSFASQIIFNPDGRTIASTSDAQRIRFWDIYEQKQVGIVEGFMPWVLAVAFSPDGRILASDNNAMIMFWDVKDQKPIGDSILPEGWWFSGNPGSIAFSPDGKLLAAGAHDGFIYLIDAQEQKKMGLLKGHTDTIRSLAFSPDGKLLASGSLDMSLRLWDVEQQREIEVFRCPSHTHSVAFSPDGETLACAIGGENAVRMWDVKTRKQTDKLQAPNPAGAGISTAISPDGETLASGGRQITFWDFPKKELIRTVSWENTEFIRHLMFSPDNKWLASQGNDGTCRLWDVETGEQLANLEGHKGPIRSMSFSANGKWLATGGEDGTILLWEVNLHVPGVSVEPSGKQLGKWGEVKKTGLYQNFPNPFNPETWIPFSLSKPERVVIRIYTSTGRLARTLDLGQKPSGAHMSREKAAYWDGKNDKGEPVASDVYFYAMEAGESPTELRKMVMVR